LISQVFISSIGLLALLHMAWKTLRWTFANTLPVFFVSWVIGTIWVLYCWLHVPRMLQLWIPKEARDAEKYQRGMMELWVSQTLTAILLICFLRAICTDPGSVPETLEWQSENRWTREKVMQPKLYEAKQNGDRRLCKWCNGFKPDRCHHCRVCKSCILRMDHHCPWIANCVGFHNHKYFFLLVFYSLITCNFIVWTMSQTLYEAVFVDEIPSIQRFLLVFGMTLSAMMAFLLFFFFAFHLRLMLVAATTIESCEKWRRPGTTAAPRMPNYQRGWHEDLQSVLGPHFLLWLLPVYPPVGDGLFFPLNKDNPGVFPQKSTWRDSNRAHNIDDPLMASEPERVVDAQDPTIVTRDLAAPEVTGERAAVA